MQNQDGVELRWIIMVLRRWWWVIAVCTLVTPVLAIAYTSLSRPVYDATATLLIQPAKDSRSSEASILTAGERLTLTYSQMIKSQPVLQMVIEQEGSEMTPNQLAGKITSIPVADTQLMRLTVRDSSAEQAAYLANTISQAFTSFIKEMNVERYATSLTGMQEKMDELDSIIQETQSSMNEYRASMIESQADLTHQENNLTEFRTEYQTVQRDYQDLQLTVSQLKENVSVIEAAHATDSEGDSAYTASVTLFLTDEDLASTYIRILKGQPVLEETIALLGLSESPGKLTKRITVDSLGGTHLILLKFSDDSESQAILIADTLALVFIDQVQKLVIEPYVNNLTNLSTQLDELTAIIERTQLDIESLTFENVQSETELGRLEGLLITNQSDFRTLQRDYEQLILTASDAAESVVLSEPAIIPENPIQRGRLYSLLALVIGLMVGIGLAFFLEYLDDTIKTPQEITETLGLSALGSIPKVSDGEKELVVIKQPRSPSAEAFRILGTNLRFFSLDKSLNVLLVTSPEPEAGKSVIVANLGAAIALLGIKVIIVDADLRRPRQHVLFSLPSREGLTRSLIERTSEGRIQPTEVEGLKILPSGKNRPPNPTELLGSHTMENLLKELASQADMILIDSPPVLDVADTSALTPSVDGILLVLESGVTRPEAAQQALANLQQVGGNVIGAVLNSVPIHTRGSYYYYQEISPSEDNLVGKRRARQSESFPAVRDWFQNQGILPSIRGWFQSKR